ncbi:MAG: hypothetical protein JOZ52_07555 [Acidobacteria bacterium]|nr:hypothetical protein [Acidobacteriota bacterium]
MSKAQYILLLAIIGFYSALFVTLIVRSSISLWQATRREAAQPQPEKFSRVVRHTRSRAWTRAVAQSSLLTSSGHSPL